MSPSRFLYTHPRILGVFVLGIASGAPLPLVYGTFSARLKDVGTDLTTIGYLTVPTLLYSLKFLWAPLIDQLRLPVLTRTFGQRRGWLFATQIATIAAILLLGWLDPVTSPPLMTALCVALLTFCSASQDIVIDAYRVELLDDDQQAAGAASVIAGYRIGMTFIAGAVLFALVDQLSQHTDTYTAWFAGYAMVTGCILAGMLAAALLGDPGKHRAVAADATQWSTWFRKAVIAPLAEFTGRNGWVWILLFILLFKLGEAAAGMLRNPFLLDLGFTLTDIAAISKAYGLAALFAGAFFGGWLSAKVGLLRTLWIAGIAQLLSNFLFIWQAEAGADLLVLTLVITGEEFSGGLGTSAFVAYLSRLCNASFTATQYALLSSLATVGRTLISANSGWFADTFGWSDFFIASAAAAIPGLVCLWVVSRLKTEMQ